MHEAYTSIFSAFFSTPTNVLSSEYIIEDPFAQDLSVQCGVFPRQNLETVDIYFPEPGGKHYSNNHM